MYLWLIFLEHHTGVWWLCLVRWQQTLMTHVVFSLSPRQGTPPVCVVQLLCACILIECRNLTNEMAELNLLDPDQCRIFKYVDPATSVAVQL